MATFGISHSIIQYQTFNHSYTAIHTFAYLIHTYHQTIQVDIHTYSNQPNICMWPLSVSDTKSLSIRHFHSHLYLPNSHLSPNHPGGHSHLKEPTRFLHVATFSYRHSIIQYQTLSHTLTYLIHTYHQTSMVDIHTYRNQPDFCM